MFGKWFVEKITMNIEGGVASTIEQFDTEKRAMDKFYTYCDQFGTNPAVAIVVVRVLNPYADVIKAEGIDNTQYTE